MRTPLLSRFNFLIQCNNHFCHYSLWCLCLAQIWLLCPVDMPLPVFARFFSFWHKMLSIFTLYFLYPHFLCLLSGMFCSYTLVHFPSLSLLFLPKWCCTFLLLTHSLEIILCLIFQHYIPFCEYTTVYLTSLLLTVT